MREAKQQITAHSLKRLKGQPKQNKKQKNGSWKDFEDGGEIQRET